MIEATVRFVSAFAITIPSVWQKPRNLSGGNHRS